MASQLPLRLRLTLLILSWSTAAPGDYNNEAYNVACFQNCASLNQPLECALD